MIKGVNLWKVFKSGIIGKKKIYALKGVNLEIKDGETLALVGESGSGKSTLGRILLMLIKPDEGKVIFDGVDLTSLGNKELRKYRLKMQLIPYLHVRVSLLLQVLANQVLLVQKWQLHLLRQVHLAFFFILLKHSMVI